MSNVIVCGVDRSAGFSRAATVAARLSEQLGCEVALVHVDREERIFASIARARQLRDLAELVDAYALPVRTGMYVRDGDPAEELARAALELDAQLLVVGSHGRREFGRALLGSVSSELMRSAACPVVVVPPEAALPPESASAPIVCGVQGGDVDRGVLQLADDLRRRLGATLHAVHAFNPSTAAAGPAAVMPPLVPELSEAAHARLARALSDPGVDADTTVLALPPAQALAKVAEEDRAMLLVVGSGGHGKLASVLQESVSIQLAAAASCPVVVLPARAEVAAGSGHYEVGRHAA